MEEIAYILQRDLIISAKRGIFSNPSEITAHVNNLLDASFSSRAISVELQEIGWQRCGSSRAKRKHDNKSAAYYWKENRQSKALLLPSAKTNTQSEPQSKGDPSEGESLSEIDKTFKIARRDKEENLASIRKVEVSTSKVKRDHLEISLAKERSELISKVEVQRVWERAIVYIKTNLYTLPERFSQRWASEESEEKIYEEFIKELDALLNRFASDGERIITQNEDTETENEAS